MFSYLDLEPQTSKADRQSNLERILESIEDFFSETGKNWVGDRTDSLLHLVTCQTIGIALKS